MNRTIRMPQLLRSMNKFSKLVVCALAVVSTAVAATDATPPSPGQTGQALIDLTGTNGGANEAGVYTSPYFGTITPYGGSTVSTAMICDDYYDNSYLNEEWVAQVTNLSSLNSGSNNPNLLYTGTTWVDGGTTYTLSQSEEYVAVAILATDVMNANDEGNASLAAAYGFAIWDLTNVQANTGVDSCDVGQTSCYGTTNIYNDNVLWQVSDISGILGTASSPGFITSAVQEALDGGPGGLPLSPSAYANVNIYSYYSPDGVYCPGGGCAPPPQEFITVSMDEPSMPILLGFYGICAIGLGVAFRRRIVNKLG